MQTPIRIFRTYATAAPVINRYANQEQREYPVPVRLFSDDDDFEDPQIVRSQQVDPRYDLRRVDNDIHSVHEPRGRVDYSMCVDTDDEKTC